MTSNRTFVKLKDARGKTVQGAIDPSSSFSAGQERLSDGSIIEPWSPRKIVTDAEYLAEIARARAEKNERLEKIRVERKRQQKLKKKSQRRGR